MTKPVTLKGRILEDPIVLDGIRAINVLKEERKVKGRIAGGMAVQGYIPIDLHRPTIDLDYSLLWNGPSTAYRELCAPLVKFLQEKGYEVTFGKKGLAYEFIYTKGDSKNSFMIQHPHKSEKHFNRVRHTLERELENQRVLTKENVTFESLSPEDIIATKLNRILVFARAYGLQIPKDIAVGSLRESSDALRAEIASRSPEVLPSDVAQLRLVNDMYDIKCLSQTVGINTRYLEDVLKDWNHGEDDHGILLQLEVSH